MSAPPRALGAGWKRTTDTQELLFKAKTWVLADSISTAAVSTYPVGALPGVYTDQYQKYKLGVGLDDNKGIAQSKAGFGLRTPDLLGQRPDDEARPQARHDGRLRALERHAPRLPSRAHLLAEQHLREQPQLPGARGRRGSRRQLRVRRRGAVGLRALRPAARSRPADEDRGRRHRGVLARRPRLHDGRVDSLLGRLRARLGQLRGLHQSTVGVWRRVMFVGRGIGGKYLTALDVTGTGPYTIKAAETGGPIPLWSRGNPDVQYGALGGNEQRHRHGDKTAYAKMGETWSLPVVGLRQPGDRERAIYTTARRPSPNGPEFVLFVGSGYGDDSGCAIEQHPCEGRTFYTLDALSGDVIAAVDVGARSRDVVPERASSPTRPASTRRPTSRSRAFTRPSPS